MAKVSAIDKYLKEQQKKEEQQRKKQVESQTKAIQSTNKNANMDSGVSDSIKNLLKKQAQTSNNKSTSFLSGTPKREEVKPVQIKKNVPERSFLTGEQEDSKVVNQSQKKKLTDYSSIGEYRKDNQENYKKNKEIALQDEPLQKILAMDQTKERDMAKDKYMQDTNLSWRLNELRNKNNKSIEEENELAQLEHKLLELTNLRRANDTLVDDAILDAAGVVSNTYNSAAYNTDLLLQSIFNPNEKLVETRNADLINQVNSGRANTTQALNDSYGEWAGFLYQTGLSISDNLALRVLNAFVPGASLIAMGSNAAASKALDIGVMDEDATAFEQLGRGLTSGGIEFLTEKMSFGALDELLGGKNSRSILRGMIDQAIEEGREEGLSYAFNLGADALWGDEVQWDWGEFAQSVLGGAISGGVMGGPSTFIGNQRFNRMARDIKNNANVQQQFKDKANIEDISMMSDEEFADLLSNSFESIKDDVGEKKFNKMKIDEIMELVPDHMTKGEKKMWQAGNDLDFQRAIQMKSQDPLTAMTSRDLVKQNVKQVAQEYGLNERTVEVINGVIDSTGVNVVFTTDMKGQEDADGYYQNGTIYINPNGKKPYMQTLKHELTHHIQYNPEFADIKNYLIGEYQGTDASAYRDANGNIKHFTFNDLVARTTIRYAEAGQQLSMEDAEFEALADLVSTSSLFADEKGISKLANTHTDATLKEKIADFFGNMASRFNGNSEYKNELERTRNLYVESSKLTKESDFVIEEDGVSRYSIATYEQGGREYLINWLKNNPDLLDSDKEDIVTRLDEAYKMVKQLAIGDEFQDFSSWSSTELKLDKNGVPRLSVITPNGDYALNIDFSQVCKKRKTLNAVINELVKSGDLDNRILEIADIGNINRIIKENGFEIACGMCFVDSKRYRQGLWAKDFTDKYNTLVKSLIPAGSDVEIDEYNFTNRSVENPTENLLKDLPQEELDYSYIDQVIQENSPGKAIRRYAEAIKQNPSLRSLLNPAEIMASDGLDTLRLEHPDLFELVNSHQGSAKPKLSHGEVPFGNDILLNNKFTPEEAYSVGGVRVQSFSDYVPYMFFDYVQMISELEAKGLPSHAYTKEVAFAKLFGLTGMKINLSIMPKAANLTEEQQARFNKMTKAERNKDAEFKEFRKHAGLDENGNYLVDTETFPLEEAYKLQSTEGYDKNVGIIWVGVSDAHIEKMLDDDNIPFIIPYHKSSLNPTIARMRNTDIFTDYTKLQNTRYDSEKKKKVPANIWTFDFYGDLQKTNDPRQTARNYVDECEKRGYLPKFDQWARHDNYYKLLIDFRVFDSKGNYAPQQPVRLNLPNNVNELVKESLSAYQGETNKLSNEMKDLLSQVRSELKIKPKYSISSKDSLGKSLSSQQQNYFKNSKVVDKNGNLQVVYHGTPNGEFTVFDENRIGETTDEGEYGRGFYFTDVKEGAESYAEGNNAKLYKEYLNLTNPLRLDKIDEYNRIYSANRGKIAHEDILSQIGLTDEEYEKMSDAAEVLEDNWKGLTIEELGFDGVIQGNENGHVYVAIRPNQIKNVDNVNPTENKDIRYSISSKYTNDVKDIMKKYGSLQMRNSQEVEQVLSNIAKEIATTGNFTEDNKNTLMKLIRENVMASRDENSGEIYQEIKNQFGGTKLYVDEKYDNFLKRHNLRNRLRGLFTLTSDKANADYSIDSFYNELVENYNGVFEQFDTEEDQLLELANKLKEIKSDNKKMQPIGETNEYFFSEQGVVDDINKYLNNMKSRINQMPDAVKNRVTDVYTLLNAERFVEKNTRLQNFNKYYFNNINEEAVRTLGVYAKRSENTQKLFQNAIQEVAEGGDITNKTRDALINDLVSQLDKTNEIKLDEYTEQQMKFFKADTDSTFKSIVKDELNNLIRDVQFAMAYADGELLDDKAIKQAQTRYEKQLREETRNTKVKMASEIVGRTPQEQLKQMGVFDVLQTKESFERTNTEFDNGIAEGDDVGQITGLDAAMINELRENGVDKTSFNKTLSQVFDVIAGKSPRLREMLRASIERPLDNAKKRMFDDQKHNLEKLSQAMKKYGIKAGSKESKAVQWYGEGTKDVNDPDAKPYTLVDLQQEFPDKWQDIVAFEKFCRQMYDDYFERINRARQSIYPNPMDQAYVDLANAQERVNKYERIIANSKTNNIYDENFISKQYQNLERAKGDVQRITEAINNGDYTLNKVLPKRKDYFHHFQEIAVEHGNVLKIINNPNDYKISNKLSGLSEGTKPKAKFTGFMQHRNHAEYEADAVGGLLKYIPVAEYAIHIDPQTAHLRGIIKAMRDTSNADDTDLAYTINYLTHFANNLAGKTFILDRIVTDVIPGGRKVMQALKAINSRVKGNAILGNVRSAISQFYNLPTGLSMIKNPASMAKGAMQYARYLKGEKNAVNIMNQSSFLQERYFDKVYNELDLNDDSQIKKMATWMMQFGDEVVSRNIWFGAYEDAISQNMNQQEAISYADNLTRNAVAGRGIGEVPLLQQSEVIKLFAPFQVEVNNQWQYLKQLTNDVVSGGPDEKKKAAWQMFIMFAVTWGMNELRERFLDGNRTGMDLVDSFIDVFNSVNEGDVSFTTTAGRVGGEVLSNMPYASQLTPLLLDETQSEALFGDADPTRFGTQNIGFSGLLSPLVQAAQGKDIDVQGLAFDYLTPWGGSQLDRTIGYMQDRGWIPDLRVNTKEGISLEQNEVAGSYSDNGRLRYALDEEDVPETIRGLLFGTTGTQAAREYYDNGAKSLSDAKTQAYVEARKAGATYKEMDGVMNDITKFESLKDGDGDSITYSKGKQTAAYIDDLSMNAKAKETLYKTYALSDSQREVYDKAIAAGGSYNQLKDAMFDIAMMESIKDKNGKSISNSKALQTAKYINELNVSDKVKNVLREEYLSKTVKEMNMGEVYGRLKNLGVGGTSSTSSYRSSRSKKTSVPSVSSRIRSLLNTNSSNKEFTNRLKQIVKEFESKSKVS